MSYNEDLQSNNAELQAILRTVNSLPNASGGSGGGLTTATLWEGSASNGSTITLSDDYANYDYLIAIAGISGSKIYQFTGVFSVSDMSATTDAQLYLSTPFEANSGAISNYCGMVLERKSSSTFSIVSKHAGWNSAALFRLIGVKINGGIIGGSVTEEQIQSAVNKYLEENPVEGVDGDTPPADMELIASGVLAEDSGLMLSKDSNGNAIELKEAVLVIKGSFNNPSSCTRIYCNNVSGGSNTFIEMWISGKQNERIWVTCKKGYPMTIERHNDEYGLYTTEGISADSDGNVIRTGIIESTIKKVGITVWNGVSVLKAGAIYALYGVRA